jgi:diguanylate cyclase (GGDEF)-like protein
VSRLEANASVRSAGLEWSIGIVGVLVAVWKLPHLIQLPIGEIVFLLVLAVVLEAVPVPMGKAEGTLIIVVPLGVAVAYSPDAAICVLTAAELITPFVTKNRRKWSTWLFNAGQYSLSAFFMSLVYEGITGAHSWQGVLDWTLLAGVLFGGLTFMLVNHLFIISVLAVRGDFVRSDLSALISNDGLNFLASLPFALLFILATNSFRFWAPLLMVPLALVSQLLRLYRRMTVLRDIHTAVLRLTSEFDIDTICEQAATTAAKVTFADSVGVYIMTDARDTLIPSIIYPPVAAQDFDLQGIRKADGGVIWSIVESGTWGYVPHVKKDPRVRDNGMDGRKYLSMAVFPMQTRGELQGAIVLHSLRPYAFGAFAEYIQVLSGQVGVLIENAKLYQQLQEQSWHDGATGLYNYRFLYEELDRRMRQSPNSGQGFSLAVLDLDYFKKFNDTYGHLAGDAVLRSVAALLRSLAGPDAIVARYGGEEFAVVLPDGAEAAYHRIESIRLAILRHVVEFQGYRLQGITVSGGIASYPEHAADDRDLLLKADSAMYWGAKERGRNRVAMYAPEFETQLFVDKLTGLYTYHFLNIRVREEVDRGVRTWGILCIDLENFAFINSAFGFDVGDDVLREASRILSDCLRSQELACRFGGDEFLILLPGVSTHELVAISERVQRAIQSHRFDFSSKVLLSVRVRKSMDVCEDVVEPGTLFEQVGQLFSQINTQKVTDLPSV